MSDVRVDSVRLDDVRLDRGGPDAVLHFERRLAHPPEKVWTALSTPAGLSAWFPAEVELELAAGAPVRFTFPGEPEPGGTGTVLAVEPPRLLEFTWNGDVLRFEVAPDGAGALLRFDHTLHGGAAGARTAGRTTVGWRVCLDALDAVLGGREFTRPTDWLTPMRAAVEQFGLDKGSIVDGDVVLARDLGWSPAAKVWDLLPARPEGVEADPPRALSYPQGGGEVRWEITEDPDLGTHVSLVHSHPDDPERALAEWEARLSELFTAANS